LIELERNHSLVLLERDSRQKFSAPHDRKNCLPQEYRISAISPLANSTEFRGTFRDQWHTAAKFWTRSAPLGRSN
jgi:hypothetical protein